MEQTCMLMDVKRFAVHDGPGVRTTLFLKGCSLKCLWCHNPEGIGFSPQMAYYAHKCINCGECVRVCNAHAQQISEGSHIYLRDKCVSCGACEDACLGKAMKLFGRKISVEQALDIATEDIDFYGENGGVTVSGGEPLMQSAFVAELFTRLKALGINTAIDTCGNVAWSEFERVLDVTDIFLYDIKHISAERHAQLTGSDNIKILSNIESLSKAGKCIEVRIPLVPGCNDDDKTLHGIGEMLGRLNIEKVRVLPYHSLARSKYRALDMPDTMPQATSPSKDEVSRAEVILAAHGIKL